MSQQEAAECQQHMQGGMTRQFQWHSNVVRATPAATGSASIGRRPPSCMPVLLEEERTDAKLGVLACSLSTSSLITTKSPGLRRRRTTLSGLRGDAGSVSTPKLNSCSRSCRRGGTSNQYSRVSSSACSHAVCNAQQAVKRSAGGQLQGQRICRVGVTA